MATTTEYRVTLTFTVEAESEAGRTRVGDVNRAIEAGLERTQALIESWDLTVREAEHSIEHSDSWDDDEDDVDDEDDDEDDVEEPEEWRDLPAPGTTRYVFKQLVWVKQDALQDALIVRPCVALAVIPKVTK